MTEALENYSAHHPESVEELLHWPARKFDHFYLLFQKRQVINGLEAQKNAMVSALWSNSNWDDTKGTRKSAIDKLESQYQDAIAQIQAIGTTVEEPGEEIDKENPFFAASERGLKKLYAQYEGQDLPRMATPEEQREWMEHVDQN